MVQVFQCWEKRDWGLGRKTWRRQLTLHQKFPWNSWGPSEYAHRKVSNKLVKRLRLGLSLQFGFDNGLAHERFKKRLLARERQKKREARAAQTH